LPALHVRLDGAPSTKQVLSLLRNFRLYAPGHSCLPPMRTPVKHRLAGNSRPLANVLPAVRFSPWPPLTAVTFHSSLPASTMHNPWAGLSVIGDFAIGCRIRNVVYRLNRPT
jgi:hypothetical protein